MGRDKRRRWKPKRRVKPKNSPQGHSVPEIVAYEHRYALPLLRGGLQEVQAARCARFHFLTCVDAEVGATSLADRLALLNWIVECRTAIMAQFWLGLASHSILESWELYKSRRVAEDCEAQLKQSLEGMGDPPTKPAKAPPNWKQVRSRAYLLRPWT